MEHFTTNIYASTDRNRKFKKYDAINQTFPNSKLITGQEYFPSDLAIIHSWINKKVTAKKLNRAKTNMKLYKNQIIGNQFNLSKHVMSIDNSLFIYKDRSHQYNYLRYSIDGIYANTGYYFDRDIDKTRWDKIKNDLSIDVKPWRKTGEHVLLCLQRSTGFSFDYEKGMVEWLTKTLFDISKVTNRKIIIRRHPGEVNIGSLIHVVLSNVTNPKLYSEEDRVKNHITISSSLTIEEDLNNAWCCLVYNSSPSVVSAIEGVPVFILDPEPQKSQSYPIANIDLNFIETPKIPDNRQEWLEQLAMSHFSYEDIENSLLYQATFKFFEEKNGRL